MRFTTFLSALLIACVGITAANAEPFSGPHVEVDLGWSHRDQHLLGTHLKDDGLLYGLGAGYDYRFGKVVAGVIGEFSDTTGKSCGKIATGVAPFDASGRACVRGDRALFGGARLGYVASDHAMLYVLGGYENARWHSSFDGTINGVGLKDMNHVTADRYRVGGGVEYALSSRAFIKAEYRYSNEIKDRGFAARHQIVTGVGLRF